jgi:hypothetical protein
MQHAGHTIMEIAMRRILDCEKNVLPYFRTAEEGSGNDRLMGFRVRILPRAWMSVFLFQCYMLSRRGLCEGPIPHLEGSYRL